MIQPCSWQKSIMDWSRSIGSVTCRSRRFPSYRLIFSWMWITSIITITWVNNTDYAAVGAGLLLPGCCWAVIGLFLWWAASGCLYNVAGHGLWWPKHFQWYLPINASLAKVKGCFYIWLTKGRKYIPPLFPIRFTEQCATAPVVLQKKQNIFCWVTHLLSCLWRTSIPNDVQHKAPAQYMPVWGDIKS